MSSDTNILIVGGAGFIGSYVNKILNQRGYSTLILDDLSRGNRQSVCWGEFIEGSIGNQPLLDDIFKTYPIKAVMHFAAYINVGESVEHPARYYRNNVVHTLQLLDTMLQHHIKIFIFSSSAAIYGNPMQDKIKESHPCSPINPYGETKWIVENILRDYGHAYGLKSCSLRYFNAAGGDPEGLIKNYQTRPTNLIPIALQCLKEDRPLTVFGTDYPTRDGTCIRDYIHIDDLASAHILGMEKLFAGEPSCFYNLGNGKGYSVKEVIQTIERVTGKKLKVIEGPKRAGDPPMLLADASKAYQELGWYPHYPDLETIINHAWLALNH